MQALIRDGDVIGDEWVLLTALDDDDALPDGRVILPLEAWLERRSRGQVPTTAGVWLDSHENPAPLQEHLKTLPLVAVNFPVFSDGRGFSHARWLREAGYAGELRAIGDVLRDQLFFMKRCGFDSFALRADQNVEHCLAAFRDFSESYQAAVDQPLPLFRRR